MRACRPRNVVQPNSLDVAALSKGDKIKIPIFLSLSLSFSISLALSLYMCNGHDSVAAAGISVQSKSFRFLLRIVRRFFVLCTRVSFVLTDRLVLVEGQQRDFSKSVSLIYFLPLSDAGGPCTGPSVKPHGNGLGVMSVRRREHQCG